MKILPTIRRSRKLVALLGVIMTAGAVYLWQGQAGAAAQQTPVFSAVELSDAVLFNDGAAAPYLDSLNRGQVPWTDTLRAGQNAVRAAVSRNPSWGASFASRLQGGNPANVKTALHDLAVLANTTFNQLYGASAVQFAIGRLIGVFSPQFIDYLWFQRVIPLNLQRLSYPCCLEPQLDPLSTSILVAFQQELWRLPTGAPVGEAPQLIQDLMIQTVTLNLRA